MTIFGRAAALLPRRWACAGAGTLLLAGCSPLGAINALAPQRLSENGIAYGPDPRQVLDVYRPAGAGAFPVVVFLYGGGWNSGDRAMYRFVGGSLAAAGFVTIIPDYRLYPQVRYPVFLEDCAAAFAWARHNAASYGGDGTAPWLIGHSAGAYNTAMLALDDRWLKGAGLAPVTDIRGMIGLAGPYDFLPLNDPEVEAVFAPAHPQSDSQPINHVTGHAPPLLLLAGLADKTVEPSNTSRLAARVQAAGGSVQMRLYPGVDHKDIIGAFSAPVRFLAPSYRDSLAFMHAKET